MANHYTQIPTLSTDEKSQLQRWIRRHNAAQALAMRARIVLASAEGLSDARVAERIGVTSPTAYK